VADERWIAISTALTTAEHELHTRRTGEHACSAFAWIDLIGMAVWDGPDRGTLDASVRFLARRWNWSKDRTQRFLVQLERSGRVYRATQTGREPGRITICNYESYQHTRDTPCDTTETLPPTKAKKAKQGVKTRDSSRDTEVVIPEVLPAKRATQDATKDTSTVTASSIPETADDAVSGVNGARPNELVGYWISHFELHQLAEQDRRKQGAAAKRICNGRTSQQVQMAWRGMLLTFPYSKGDGFDLFDMERLFSKAVATAMAQDPSMRVSRLADRLRQTEREEDHARS